MNFNKTTWKTGALAVALTLVFAIFAFNFEDWTRGINSEFVVYGDTPIGSGGVTGTTSSLTKIIPQIAVGSFDADTGHPGGITKYTTVIQVVNLGATPITVTGSFYNQNGTPSTLQMSATTAPQPFTATLPSTTLAGNAEMVITAGQAPQGAVNWGKITTTAAASVSAYFEFRDIGTNFLYTRVGIPGSSPNLKRFIIPWIRNAQTGLDVGFALVNSGATAANITVTAKDSNGATIGSPRVYSAAAGSQVANFANQFLSLNPGPPGTNSGYLVFEGSSASFSAVALAFEAGALSSFPIEVLE